LAGMDDRKGLGHGSRILEITRDLTLQVTGFEPLLPNHQKRSRIENYNEVSFDQGKDAMKLLWQSEQGKAIKLSLGMQKFRISGNLIRKRNIMAPQMGISKKFKNVEYTTHCLDPQSEEISSLASLDVEPLALENEFRCKSLEFIVHSILVCFN